MTEPTLQPKWNRLDTLIAVYMLTGIAALVGLIAAIVVGELVASILLAGLIPLDVYVLAGLLDEWSDEHPEVDL